MRGGYVADLLARYNEFGMDLRIGQIKDGKTYVAKPIKIEFEEIPHHEGKPIPTTLHLEDDLLCVLERCFAPTKQTYVEGQLCAMREHLIFLQKFILDRKEKNDK